MQPRLYEQAYSALTSGPSLPVRQSQVQTRKIRSRLARRENAEDDKFLSDVRTCGRARKSEPLIKITRMRYLSQSGFSWRYLWPESSFMAVAQFFVEYRSTSDCRRICWMFYQGDESYPPRVSTELTF